MTRDRLFVVLTVSLIVSASVMIRPSKADLVGYWNFDGNVDDHSGTGNDGELIDASYDDNVPLQIGSGQSISFEEDFEHVYIEGDDSLDSEEFTLAMFIYDRGQVGAFERLTSRESDTFETAINVHPPFGGLGEYSYYSGSGGGWQWGDEIPPLDEWQHVTYVANPDEEEMSIYLDGELTYTSPAPWTTFPTGFMHIGNRWNDVEGFDGNIDDVALWDEVLSDDDIMTIATRGVAAFLNPAGEGDYNGDGTLDALDIDLQSAEMQKDQAEQDLAKYDHNQDGVVNVGSAGPDESKWGDRLIWIRSLRGTWVGDSNLDNEFNSSDLVKVFADGRYETGESAGWASGDWNGDMLFNSSDLVAAVSDGGYEMGPPAARAAAVPEPSSLLLLLFGALLLVPILERGLTPFCSTLQTDYGVPRL